MTMPGNRRGRPLRLGLSAREPGTARKHFNNRADPHFFRPKRAATLMAGLAICFVAAVSLTLAEVTRSADNSPLNGEQLYRHYCAQCHSKSRSLRAPQLSVLQRMQPQDVLDALEVGTMRFEGVQRT